MYGAYCTTDEKNRVAGRINLAGQLTHQRAATMKFTGERYVPEIRGSIELEHLHRYLAVKHLGSGKVVLDIACGEGYGSKILSEVALKVIGVDIADSAVKHAEVKYLSTNLEFKVGSCSKIPMPDSSVDVVISFETIEHHDEHDQMLLEIKRVLKPEGIAVISSPDRFEYSDVPNFRNEHHVKELYRREFIQLLSKHFTHLGIYGQRVSYGSVILPEAASTEFQSFEYAAGNVSPTSGVPRAQYHIAIGSDGALPSVSVGILDQRIEESEITKFWRQLMSEKDEHISELNKIRGSLVEQVRLSDAANEATKAALVAMHIGSATELSAIRISSEAELSAMRVSSAAVLAESNSAVEGLRAELTRSSEALQLSESQYVSKNLECVSAVEKVRLQDECLALAHAEIQLRVSELTLARENLLDETARLADSQRESQRLQHVVAEIYSSTSWQISSPIRYFGQVFLGFMKPFPIGGGVFNFMRKLFRMLPLPMALKDSLRFRVINRSGIFTASPPSDSEVSLFKVGLSGDALGAQVQTHSEALRWKINKQDAIGLNSWVPKTEKLLDFGRADLRSVAAKLKFSRHEAPVVTIIIPVFGNLQLTLECLSSISSAIVDTTYQIIISDDASKDATVETMKLIPNIDLLCNESNLGFVRNCNSALSLVTGNYVLYLNNDVQVTDGWLDELVKTFLTEFKVGAVGPKIVYPSGHLQEAGVALRFDGSADMVGLNCNPALPEYNFTRAVDYCSGACLMIPTEIITQLMGFSDEFAPAYCEDADLCLRILGLGYKIYYNPAAKVIHHLSKTTAAEGEAKKMHQVFTNLHKLQKKWGGELNKISAVKIIAFYLPQFHAIPENDQWWGEGFTEWTNVRKAVPNFQGHNQPRIPADLGYYDLNSKEVMHAQFDLARRYGVDGFCFYYYWFAGKRLLEMPVERMLEPGAEQFPYLLCWANENWSRRWDGRESEVLIAQSHSEQDDLAVIDDLIRHFRNPSYIRIDGRPHLVVYRVDLFPKFVDTARRWRDRCLEVGIGEIYLSLVESHDLVHKNIHPSFFGCDASIEFPPLNMGNHVKPDGHITNHNFKGGIGDFSEIAFQYCVRELPKYNRFRGVMPSWDNTARRQDNSYCFINAEPGVFQIWLETVIQQTRRLKHGDEKVVFVNAWNEWAEGAYLEPDSKFGHQFLQAVQNAKDAERLVKL